MFRVVPFEPSIASYAFTPWQSPCLFVSTLCLRLLIISLKFAMSIYFAQKFYLPNFIKIFVAVIPAIAAHIVAIHTGTIIAVGLFDPSEFRMAITVVGIS